MALRIILVQQNSSNNSFPKGSKKGHPINREKKWAFESIVFRSNANMSVFFFSNYIRLIIISTDINISSIGETLAG